MAPQSDPPLPVYPGEQLAGKYVLERVLGKGGMGFVVAARHRDLGHRVAIKMLLPDLAGRGDVVERFLREARAAANLHSVHAVRVTDVGLHQPRGSASSRPEAVPYLVMEYLQGESLGSLVRKGPLPIRQAALFIVQACEALDEAHRAGIVHRDLKPDNLFLTAQPNGAPLVKVLDFGISRVPFEDEDRRLTGTTDVMGTPHYMAPEQATAARNADGRSDVWALGVTLYELLTGRLPFGGGNVAEIIARVLSTTPPGPRALRPEIPAELDGIVMGCLEKNPDRRCPSVVDLARALAPFVPGGSWKEAPPSSGVSASEDATTLFRVAEARAARANDVPTAGWSGGTVPAGPMHVPAPGNSETTVTLDATTHIVRRRRQGAALLIATAVLTLSGVALLVWWRSGTSIPTEAASTDSGEPTSAMSAGSSVPAAAGTATVAMTNEAPPVSTASAAMTAEPTTSSTAGARTLAPAKGTGTPSLKKTRK